MKKVIRVKRTRVDDTVEGCVLVPVTGGKAHYPKVQSNVLLRTYYRVVVDDDRVRAMVTILPDSTRVAWDSCGKCHNHITICQCTYGVYHPQSIGWMRATCDIADYPNTRVTDYSMYYDPYMRSEGRQAEVRAGTKMGVDLPPNPAPKRKRQKPAPETPALSVEDIESMDTEFLNREAKKMAKAATRKVRRTIGKRKSVLK